MGRRTTTQNAFPGKHPMGGTELLEGQGSVHRISSSELCLLLRALRRQLRAQALYDVIHVAEHSRRWVQHESELSREQTDLVATKNGRRIPFEVETGNSDVGAHFREYHSASSTSSSPPSPRPRHERSRRA